MPSKYVSMKKRPKLLNRYKYLDFSNRTEEIKNRAYRKEYKDRRASTKDFEALPLEMKQKIATERKRRKQMQE